MTHRTSTRQEIIIDAEIIEEVTPTPAAPEAVKPTTTIEIKGLGGFVLSLGIVALGAVLTALCLALVAIAIVLAVPGVPAYFAYDAIQTSRRRKRDEAIRAQRRAAMGR